MSYYPSNQPQPQETNYPPQQPMYQVPPQGAQPGMMYYGPPPRRSSAKIIIAVIFVVALILILLVALLLVMGNDNSPEGVFEDYIGAVDDGDVQSVYEHSAAKFYMTYEAFADDYYYGDASTYTMHVESTTMIAPANMTYWDNWTATLIVAGINTLITPNVVDHFCIVEYNVTVEIEGYGTEQETGSITMVEIDGSWYVATEF